MALFQLPLEIRLQIFELAICSPAPKPSCPAVNQEGRKRLSRDSFHGGGIWLQRHLRNPAIPLLLANKQVYAEIKDVLKHDNTNYSVDIMFVKSYGLWTTWTIPAFPRTQYINSVRASLRLFEPTPDLDGRFKGTMSFRGGDGGPPTATWSFYTLLTGVLTHGPGYLGEPPQRNDEPRYAVKSVILDIPPPTDKPVYKGVLWEDGRPSGRPWARYGGDAPGDSSTPSEQRLARYLTNELERVLYLGYYSMDYGTIVYEGVLDDIIILVNGQEYKRYDMDTMLQEHQVRYWGETPEYIQERKEKYARWKSWVLERRQRMKEGLELNYNRPVNGII